jgi:hypothetical protein
MNRNGSDRGRVNRLPARYLYKFGPTPAVHHPAGLADHCHRLADLDPARLHQRVYRLRSLDPLAQPGGGVGKPPAKETNELINAFRSLRFPPGPRPSDHLLVKGRDRHAKPPIDSSHHPRPGGQPERQAVDGLHLGPVDHPADHPGLADAVQAAILPAGALCADLPVERQPPEVPVHVIWRAEIITHCFIPWLISVLRQVYHGRCAVQWSKL